MYTLIFYSNIFMILFFKFEILNPSGIHFDIRSEVKNLNFFPFLPQGGEPNVLRPFAKKSTFPHGFEMLPSSYIQFPSTFISIYGLNYFSLSIFLF